MLGKNKIMKLDIIFHICLINIGSGNGLLPNSTKPAPEPMLNPRNLGGIIQWYMFSLHHILVHKRCWFRFRESYWRHLSFHMLSLFTLIEIADPVIIAADSNDETMHIGD